MVEKSHPLKLGAVLASSLALTACLAPLQRSAPPAPAPKVSSPPAPVRPPPVPSAPAAPTPTPSVPPPPPPRPAAPARENHLTPATQSLVSQAHALVAHGDLDAASSTLDRALRIEPNNPLLWIELGRLRLTENDAHQAEGCGRKALALASGDPGTLKRAGHLLADSLRAQQRNQEARAAESQPYMN